MPRIRAYFFVFLLFYVSSSVSAPAQQDPFRLAPSVQRIIRPAGLIFAGTVRAIEYEPAKAPGQIVTVRITFQVEQAIRGTQSGATLTIREWAGLWNAGERYHRGERVFLFLYPPSKLGLTSTVGASVGRFAVDKSGQVTLNREQAGASGALEPSIPLLNGRIHLREFTRALRRRIAQEE